MKNNEIITDDKQNYLPEPDENNKPRINPTYYKNIINDYINNYIIESGIDRTHITGNDLLAIFRQTQQNIFKPSKQTPNNESCNIPYTTHNIESLLNVYINTCLLYKVYPSLFGFSILTGIDEATAKKYLTREGFELLNLRREMLRNDLATDKTGRIVLANNDSSFGLEYERKNTVERETIRRGLSLGDLPKLE